MKQSRFDYIQYDDIATEKQAFFKKAVIDLENLIELGIISDSKQKAIQKLEECYMWIGKGIRDDQIVRNINYQLQEKRNNS
jgi:hypothetical protein